MKTANLEDIEFSYHPYESHVMIWGKHKDLPNRSIYLTLTKEGAAQQLMTGIDDLTSKEFIGAFSKMLNGKPINGVSAQFTFPMPPMQEVFAATKGEGT